MLRFTEQAKARVVAAIEAEGKPGLGLRVTIDGRTPAGAQYGLALIGPDEVKPDDQVLDAGAFKVYLDREIARRVESAQVDYVETLMESGFKVEGADESIGWESPVAQKIQGLIDSQINPGVASHGGWVELLGVQGDTAFLRLGGGCQGCGMVDVTLKQGIEVIIRDEVPEIAHVIDQTDHAGGRNPYYQPSKG